MTPSLVIIPAYNEESSIYQVVTEALQYSDVSVTNDGSIDSTGEILEKIRQECRESKHKNSLHVITHAKSTHIPLGIQDGLKYGVEKGYSWLVTMDAGMSHQPAAIKDFLSVDNKTDIVIGTRKKTENVPIYRKAISLVASMLVNYALTDTYFSRLKPEIKDCTSGFRRYSKRAAEAIAKRQLVSKSFDFHMEALSICVRKGYSFKDVPITYVFSNSSFSLKVLKDAAIFAIYLLKTKRPSARVHKLARSTSSN